MSKIGPKEKVLLATTVAVATLALLATITLPSPTVGLVLVAVALPLAGVLLLVQHRRIKRTKTIK